MPQTRFVLQKAFELGLRPIVVINKVDRQRRAAGLGARRHRRTCSWTWPRRTRSSNFRCCTPSRARARAGWAPDALEPNLEPLFRAILEHVPPPERRRRSAAADPGHDARLRHPSGPLSPSAASGAAPSRPATRCSGWRATGEAAEAPRKVVAVYTYLGLSRTPVEHARGGRHRRRDRPRPGRHRRHAGRPARPRAAAGAGHRGADGAHDLRRQHVALRRPRGQAVSSTSRQLRARLLRELETNVSLRVEDTDSADEFLVSGRGELHLAILVETLRREGYEFQVSRPEVITRRSATASALRAGRAPGRGHDRGARRRGLRDPGQAAWASSRHMAPRRARRRAHGVPRPDARA